MTGDNPRRLTKAAAETTAAASKVRPSDNLTTEQLIELYGSKSAAIRALHAQGYLVSEIAKKVSVIYQHARNVILRPLKRVNHADHNTPPKGEGGDRNVEQDEE